MANTTKIVYVTQAQYDALVTNGSVTVGGVTYTYDANNTYLVREDGIEGVDIKSTNATNGKVLTADGNGGASWESAGGGGGSGDVTASGTLTSNCVILGNGTKSVKAMSDGANGAFLQRGSLAPEWKGLYMHTIYLNYPGDMDQGAAKVYFSVISTIATAFTTFGGVFPMGTHPAVGTYYDPNSQVECQTISIASDGTIEFINSSGYVESMAMFDPAELEVTDTVTQIL